MKFVSESGQKLGSTELGRAVLTAAAPELANQIQGIKNWRKDYLGVFAKVAKLEHSNNKSALNLAKVGLAKFESSVADDQGNLIIDQVRTAWREHKADVELVIIRGRGESKSPKIDLTSLFEKHLIEPGVKTAVSEINIEGIQEHLLIALAGGAEYSPARTWLDWGGVTAIIARPRVELWQELIEHARASSGTLYVPVLKSRLGSGSAQNLSDVELANFAGLDLVEDYEAIAGWLSMLARTENRSLVLGSYAYAPGVKHIEVQAVQHCLARVMTEALPKTRVALTWLATPTDSYVVDAEVAKDIAKRYSERGFTTKLRDLFFGVKRHQPEIFTNENLKKLAVIDSTSSLQGPSYALAKRLQRWLAYVQLFEDRKVAYLVSPPAKTRSVLDTKILNATYAGAPAFGLVPFDVKPAVDLSAALLMHCLNKTSKFNAIEMYQELAVHGGLWRLIYSPKSTWRAATVLGLLERSK